MTDVKCWICRDGFMRINYVLYVAADGLPWCECETCGAMATTTAVQQRSRQLRLSKDSKKHYKSRK